MKEGKSKADSRNSENKLAVKKTKATKEKKAKDPSKPKRPASAFFVFMEQFRKDYKEKHPENKSVAVVGKAGGNKWKSLSTQEKAPYVAKADKRKGAYDIQMKAYNKKLEGGNDDEGSDKSKSEVNDEGSEEGSDGEDEDDD